MIVGALTGASTLGAVWLTGRRQSADERARLSFEAQQQAERAVAAHAEQVRSALLQFLRGTDHLHDLWHGRGGGSDLDALDSTYDTMVRPVLPLLELLTNDDVASNAKEAANSAWRNPTPYPELRTALMTKMRAYLADLETGRTRL